MFFAFDIMNLYSLCSWAFFLVAFAMLSACSPKDEPIKPATQGRSGRESALNGPVTVSTVRAQKRDLPVLLNVTGTVVPLHSVDIKSQVNNVIDKVHVREGQSVVRGQLLFTLDARNDEVNAAKAKAQLTKDIVSLADSQRQLARAQQLFNQNFISQGGVDTAQAQSESLAANLKLSQAAVEASKIALSYTRIVAPQSGRIGVINVAPGSVVQANTTLLASITQLDPITVVYSVPQRHLQDILQAQKEGGYNVTASLADGGGNFKGQLQFVDSVIDPSSGSVKVKAIFRNPDERLWPGAVAEVSQTLGAYKDTVVLPQAVIIQSQRGTSVYAVENSVASIKPIQVLYSHGSDAAVTGVNEGDVLVLDGKQNVRPGTKVVEKEPETVISPQDRGGRRKRNKGGSPADGASAS